MGEFNNDLGLKYPLGKKASGLLGVNYYKFSNPIDNNRDGFTDLTIQDRVSVFNKIEIQQKNNKSLQIAGRFVYEDRWGGETNWTPEFRGGDSIYGESIYTVRWETFGTYQLPTKEISSFNLVQTGMLKTPFTEPHHTWQRKDIPVWSIFME